MVDAIRQTTNGNFTLDDDRFGQQIAQTAGRRAQAGKAGRPGKAAEPESGDLLGIASHAIYYGEHNLFPQCFCEFHANFD